MPRNADHIESQDSPKSGFRDTLLFPFRGYGKHMLFFGAILMGMGHMLAEIVVNDFRYIDARLALHMLKGITLGLIDVFLYGYMSLYCMAVILRTAAHREDELPDWPSLTGLFEMPRGLFILGGAVIVPFVPAIACHLLPGGGLDWLALALAAAGLFCCPMGVLAATLYEGLSGLSPRRIRDSIAKTWPKYLSLLWIVPAIFLSESPFIENLLGSAGTVVYLLRAPVTTYLLLVGCYCLGRFYREHETALDWFPRRGGRRIRRG